MCGKEGRKLGISDEAPPPKIKEYRNEEEARENGGGIALPGGNEWMDDNLGLLMGGRSGFGAQQRVVSFVREGGRALRLTLIRKGKKRKKIWGKKRINTHLQYDCSTVVQLDGK